MFPSELAVTPITITFHSLQPVTPSGELGDGLRRMFETTFKRIDEVLEKGGVQTAPFFRGEIDEGSQQQSPILKDFGTPPRGYSLSLQPGEDSTLRVSVNLFGRYAEVLPLLIPRLPSLPSQWPLLGLSFAGLSDAKNLPFVSYTELAGRPHATIGNEVLKKAQLTSNSLTLHFISPTMLFNNHNSYGNMRFADLIRSLSRRASLISHLYCKGAEPSGEFEYPDALKVNIASSSLEWYFSPVKNPESKLMGYVGRVKYVSKPEILYQFLPLILMGQWMHVGQKTNYGAGQYIVDDACYRFI